MSTRLYVPARKSSVTRRASGRTSANVGRSPKVAKCASSGTPVRRIASRPLRPTVTTATSPGLSMMSRATKRTMFVLSGPGQRPVRRDQHDQALAARRLGQQRMVLAAEHRGEVGQDLVELLAVGPRRQRRVLGALQLRRRHELHRAGDLLDVLDRADAAPDIPLARPRVCATRARASGQEASCAEARRLGVDRRARCRQLVGRERLLLGRARSGWSARSVSRKR